MESFSRAATFSLSLGSGLGAGVKENVATELNNFGKSVLRPRPRFRRAPRFRGRGIRLFFFPADDGISVSNGSRRRGRFCHHRFPRLRGSVAGEAAGVAIAL